MSSNCKRERFSATSASRPAAAGGDSPNTGASELAELSRTAGGAFGTDRLGAPSDLRQGRRICHSNDHGSVIYTKFLR